jgi:hypothetical protein
MSKATWWLGLLLGLATALAAAQPPPATDSKKEDIEPAVNTSAPSADASKPADAPKPASAPAVTPPSVATPAPAAVAGADHAKTRPAAKGGGNAHDRIELDTTEITGNRELPKVLYIVPWKRSDLGDMVGKPVNSLLDEVLQPIDRDVFQRENRYYRALTPPGAAPGAATPAATGAAPSTSNTSNGSAARDER